MLNLTSLNQRVNALTAKINNIVPPTSSNLADVLINGNNAGVTNIDMNNQDILQVDNINLVTINGSVYPPAVSTLAQVMTAGAIASTTLNMNNNIINNVNSINVIDTLTNVVNRISPGSAQIKNTLNNNTYMAISQTDLRFYDEPTTNVLAEYGKTAIQITNLPSTSLALVDASSISISNPLGNDYSQLDINSLDFADATGVVVNTVSKTGMAVVGAGTISATGGFTIPSAVGFTNPIAPTCIANPQSGLDLCNKNYVDSQAALTAYQLYFNYSIPYSVPGGATYTELSPVQIPTPATVTWTTNSTAPVLLGSFFNSLVGLNIPTSIPAGVWTLLIYANLTSSAGQGREGFFYQIYGTTALGAETLIYGSPTSLLLNTVTPLIGSVSVQGTVPLTSLTGYTGLGIRLYIQSNSATVTTGSIIYQTATSYSSILTSFASVQAPNLLGLNNIWTASNTFNSTLIGNLTGTTTNLAAGLGGQIPYQSAVNTTALLPNGTLAQVLTSAGTTLPPTWTTLPTTIATATNLAGGIASQIPYQSAAGTTAFIANGTAGQVLTSAGTAVPAWSTPSATTLANVLLAGNNAGATDINMNSKSITGALSVSSTTFTGALTGNASTATQSSNLAGGLGGQIPYQSALNTTALLPNGTAGQVLTSAGTTLPPTWGSAPAASLSAVMAVGASASTALNMATFAITNAGAIGATSLTSSGNCLINTLMVGTGANNTNPNNTALGSSALLATTTGVSNVAVGLNTLILNQSGNQNTAVGRDVLGTASTATSNNSGLGYRALYGSTLTGSNNTAVGVSSGSATTSGSNNTYLGSLADQTTATGTFSNSTAVGYNSKITGSNQIQMGTSAETVVIPGYITSTSVSGDSVNFGIGAGKATAGGTQPVFCVAIGNLAGNAQQRNSVAIGYASQSVTPSQYCLAIGTSAGETNQGAGNVIGSCVAFGNSAGQTNQGQYATAMGATSGNTNQGASAVALGNVSGQTSQGIASVAIGANAGNFSQGAGSVAIGSNAGKGTSGTDKQGINCVAIGNTSGQTTQGNNCVAIGNNAGNDRQLGFSVAIGSQAGVTQQSLGGLAAVAIGNSAGNDRQGQYAVALGNVAGFTLQGSNSVAVGNNSGNYLQGASSVAIGLNTGQTSQGANTVAVGFNAGLFSQGAGGIAIGTSAGKGTVGTDFQGVNGIAIGNTAGIATQGSSAVAIGTSAGNANQGTSAVAVGAGAGLTSQGSSGVAIGNVAGNISQGGNAVAIGIQSGQSNQGISSIAIGGLAGATTQGASAIAIGLNSGTTTQGGSAISIGATAGNNAQGGSSVAIGGSAGQTTQGISSIAIGTTAGQTSQSGSAIAIGNTAGKTTQGSNAIAIGISAGTTSQGSSAIAIGAQAGNGFVTGQGSNAIAIGNKAGESSQVANSICLNASGVAVNPGTAGFFVNPIRVGTSGALFTPALPQDVLYYDPLTNEILRTAL